MVEMVFGRYDRNRSGVLEKDEWSQFRSDPSGYDTNRDGKITREELAKGMSSRYGGDRGGDRSRGGDNDSRGSRGSESSRGGAKIVVGGEKASYRTRTAIERLPDGLPDWFARYDTDGDGQVMMYEYSTSWDRQVVADFSQFDLNKDGIVTPIECLRATEAGAVQGSPGSVASNTGWPGTAC